VGALASIASDGTDAQHVDAFYDGALTEDILASLQGAINKQDLTNYSPTTGKPISTSVNGFTVR
jgi:gamma-glutamyltranspeptidase